MPRKPRSGYVPSGEKKFGSQLPPDIYDLFHDLPGEQRAKWRNAAILWAVAQEFPSLRDRIDAVARSLGAKDAVQKVKTHLIAWVSGQVIADGQETWPKGERACLLAKALSNAKTE